MPRVNIPELLTATFFAGKKEVEGSFWLPVKENSQCCARCWWELIRFFVDTFTAKNKRWEHNGGIIAVLGRKTWEVHLASFGARPGIFRDIWFTEWNVCCAAVVGCLMRIALINFHAVSHTRETFDFFWEATFLLFNIHFLSPTQKKQHFCKMSKSNHK